MDCTECDDLEIYYPYDITFNYDADVAGSATNIQDYEFVTCNFPGVCPDGTVRNTCNWLRYLYVYCYADLSGDVSINIETNSLPDHCYY